MRIVVGLSGGVDSSVAAMQLVEQGHDVIGLFMRNWHDESVTISDDCPWIDDSNDAMLVAEHLGIPFQVIDFSKEYHERIVDYMFSEYEQGRTPNPDVLCNREIKFDLFLEAAKKLGVRAVVCMTEIATKQKIEHIQRLGAEVIIKGRDQNQATDNALMVAKEQGLTFIPAFDDPHIIAGQGTIGLEILTENPHIDTLIVQVSGGGLMSGVALAARSINPNIKIIGVTCHNSKKLVEKAINEKVDYIALGAFYPSNTKNVKYKASIKLLKLAKKMTDIPIVAIGGINLTNYKKLLLNKANFLAISGYIWNNKKLNPIEAISKLK